MDRVFKTQTRRCKPLDFICTISWNPAFVPTHTGISEVPRIQGCKSPTVHVAGAGHRRWNCGVCTCKEPSSISGGCDDLERLFLYLRRNYYNRFQPLPLVWVSKPTHAPSGKSSTHRQACLPADKAFTVVALQVQMQCFSQWISWPLAPLSANDLVVAAALPNMLAAAHIVVLEQN